MNVLVTGGAGYIGSHTCVQLLEAGHHVVVVDNFYNSCPEVLKRIETITGKIPTFYEVDLVDKPALEAVFQKESIDAVMHFAGYKAVGESVAQPLKYYSNNITSTLNLCELMLAYGCHQLVFSSSATVYGLANHVPFTEDMPTSATNPYGYTKVMIEQILDDLVRAHPGFKVALLRYFNPIGAHSSGLIGEQPSGVPNNLMPYITQVAVGKRDQLSIFGDDYPTSDGTGVRDYIHVDDLASGHLAALRHLATYEEKGAYIVNLGTGQGISVLELVKTFEEVNQVRIPYQIAARRPGDIASCYASTSKAKSDFNWQTQKTLEDMCRDSWRWQEKNPEGY